MVGEAYNRLAWPSKGEAVLLAAANEIIGEHSLKIISADYYKHGLQKNYCIFIFFATLIPQ